MWMGDSRGRFEGDTLVIETTNFTDRTGIGGNGNGAVHSEKLTLVERLRARRRGHAALRVHGQRSRDLHAAVDRARSISTSQPGYEIYEYACHEGNYGLANMLSAARAEERAAAEAKR